MTFQPTVLGPKEASQGHAGRPKRIHITGSPRSGTTLLLSLMLSCFEIDGGVTEERRLWRTPPKGKRIVCTKFPDETDFSTRMLGLDPDLHVIFMLRDPRDVVVSQSHISPDRYLTNLRVWKENLEQARPWFGHRRFHVVNYAELVAEPDRVQAELAADMPFLVPSRNFSRFFETANESDGAWLKTMHMKLRPIAADNVGNWRKHAKRVKGQMIIHGDISEDLIAMGFEPDRSWLSELQRARPNIRASAALERAHFGKRVTRRWRNALGTLIYLARRYAHLELSDTGENAPREHSSGSPINENNLVLISQNDRRSSRS